MSQLCERQRKNIAIVGLTAAGKTTHARLLQSIFGLGYISASTLLRERAGFTGEPQQDFWLSGAGLALGQRLVEIDINQELREAEASRDYVVFDCRSLPWLMPNPPFSIWLESSLESRVWKALVSHRGNVCDSEEIKKAIMCKDQQDRDRLLQTFGFDLFRDYEPIDVMLDLSTFITAPSPDAAYQSIILAQDILSTLVGLYIRRDDFYRMRFQKVFSERGEAVFRHFSQRFLQLVQ